jgi:enoyl-CoA hydratase/carnithine racemase
VAFIAGGIVMLIVERLRPVPVVRAADQTPIDRAVGIGVFQTLALVPGVSRSGATIVGGLLLSWTISSPRIVVGRTAHALSPRRDYQFVAGLKAASADWPMTAGWIDWLLEAGPEAIAECKRLVRDASAPLALPDLAERLARARASDEGQEGVTAFLEKRKPRWASSAGS